MAIADVKANKALKKDVLVRLEHGRYPPAWISLGGNQYSVAYQFTPSRVEQSGSSITYAWDGTTLIITTTTSPSPTNPVVIYTHLYLTGGEAKYFDKDDPTGALTNPVEWEPKLLNKPTVTQNISNILEGVISISSSSLKLDNSTSWLDDYLFSYSSFFNKPATIWFGLDDEYSQVFVARISSISSNQNTITISIKDAMKDLLKTCYMGDSLSESYTRKADYPNVSNLCDGQPIPLHFGAWSPTKIRQDGNSSFITSPDWETMTQMNNYDSSEETDPTKFIMGRFQSFTTARETVTPTSSTTVNIDGSTYTRFGLSTSHLIKTPPLGMYRFDLTGFIWKSTSNIDYDNNYIYFSGSYTSTTSLRREESSRVWLADGSGSYGASTGVVPGTNPPTASAGNDLYTTTTSSTTNGSTLVKITLASPSGSNNSRAYVAAASGSEITHANALKFILEESGITVNVASFTQADSDLTANVQFRIPSIDETDYGTILSYANKLTRSTFGIIFVNKDGEVEYKIIKSLGTPSIVISETDILDNSLSIKTEYQDIVTDYTTLHGESELFIDHSNNQSDGGIAELNNYDLAKTDDTYLSSNADSVISRKFDFLQNQRVTYTFSSPMKFIEIEIGDEITVESSKVKNGSVNLMVTGYAKSLDKVQITAMEIRI